MAAMKFTHAVVSRIPQSFRTKCDVNLDEARKQHEGFVKLLRELGLDVIELPPDESLPECVFVEDTAITCNGTALITRPSSPTRLKEVETIRSVLKKELDLPVIEIEDEEAKLDGGDVLFTGREFFVGLSDRTNEAGAKAVAAAFPEYSCIPVTVPERYRLKNLVSVAGPDLLCVAASKPAQDVIKRIEREASYSYTTLTVPEERAANVLFVNGTLVHRAEEEIPDSCRVFGQLADFSRRSVKVSELGKLGHSLSSCCLLIRRSKYIKWNINTVAVDSDSLTVRGWKRFYGINQIELALDNNSRMNMTKTGQGWGLCLWINFYRHRLGDLFFDTPTYTTFVLVFVCEHVIRIQHANLPSTIA